MDTSMSNTGSDSSSSRELFDAVVSLIRNSSPSQDAPDEVDESNVTTNIISSSKMSDTTRLRLYGLYKRCTVGRLLGDCDGDDASSDASDDDESEAERGDSDGRPTVRPSILNPVARAKYDAWEKCNGRSRHEARMTYVRLASEQENGTGRQCLELLKKFEASEAERVASRDTSVGNGLRDNAAAKGGNDFGSTVGISNSSSGGGGEDVFEDALEELPLSAPSQTQQQQGQKTLIPPESTATSLTDSRTDGNKGNIDGCRTATTTPASSSSSKEEPPPPPPPRQKPTSLVEKYTGIQPLIPRGHLDISFTLLGRTVVRCLTDMIRHRLPLPGYSASASGSRRRRKLVEDEIAKAWLGRSSTDNDDIVVGLSVRSLLDCYLRSKSFRRDSEIILVPCITIPGMVDIMQYHGIRVVPVDILPQQEGQGGDGDTSSNNSLPGGVIGVDILAVRAAVTPRTVAIMVAHPFGMICTSNSDMERLRLIADENELDLIEDCAECYSGPGYSGSPYADLSLFSFGTIKTATALGGGIAVVRRQSPTHNDTSKTSLGDEMRRVQCSLYEQQSNAEYLFKVLKCSLLHLISLCPLLCGMIYSILIVLGIDYDTLVTSAIRGFAASGLGTQLGARRTLIEQIRKRPCSALLSLIHHRVSMANETSSMVKGRIKRCELLTKQVSSKFCSNGIQIPRGVNGSRHLYWLYPIVVQNPGRVSRIMLQYGFDVPAGTSQLASASAVGVEGNCLRADSLMKGILYLPVAGQATTKSEMKRMLDVLNYATQLPSAMDESRCQLNTHIHLSFATAAVVVVIAMRSYSWLDIASYLFHSTIFLMIWAGIITSVLRAFVSADYLSLSTALSRYSVADFKESRPNEKHRSAPALDVNVLRMPDSIRTERNDAGVPGNGNDKMVLLTGATGFIGSLLLRELLLYRKSLGIDGVVVICRPKGSRTAQERVTKLLSTELFSFLTEQEKETIVVVVNGDVSSPNVGMSLEDANRINSELQISHVFHCAASVSFTQTLEEAAMSNITSSLQLQQLTKQLRNKSARYVYISTAFVHGASTGSDASPLLEQLHSLRTYDPNELYRSMLDTQSYASAAMYELGFPNTYTFSKSVCEHLLLRDRSVDTIIIRPSIVGPAVACPYEGWAGEKPSTLVAAACLYLKFPYNLWSFGKTNVPFIPVDVVCRFILAKAFAQRQQCASTGQLLRTIVRDRTIRGGTPASSEDGSYEKISIPKCMEISSDGSRSTPSDVSMSSDEAADSTSDIGKHIFTAAWDTKSSPTTSFLWIEYAITITHVGSVFGYLSRLVAFIGMVFTVKLFPRTHPGLDTYRLLHTTFVLTPLDLFCTLLEKLHIGSAVVRNLHRLRPFLDLPLLFFPFTNNSYHFDSELVAPDDFDGKRYMLSSALAAERFVRCLEKRTAGKRRLKQPKAFKNNEGNHSNLVIAGQAYRAALPDYLWAISQPKGNVVIRIAGWVMMKLFRMTMDELTVDIGKLALVAEAKRQAGRPCHIVLAPTHRSLFDFLIVSFIAFALPELGVEIPYIAAAEDFERIPLLGFIARGAGAFFLRRGRGTTDPSLVDQVKQVKSKAHTSRSACIEVFIEGGRSRDRRFPKPRTGFLRCLEVTGGDHIILPITINYEAIPEQGTFAEEATGVFCPGNKLELSSLLQWIKEVVSGSIHIGRVHVSASEPLLMATRDSGRVSSATEVAKSVQSLQMNEVFVSSYHIEMASRVLCLEHKTVRKAATSIGCKMWKPHCSNCLLGYCGHAGLPSDRNEQFSVMLHFGHVFAPLLRDTRPKWSDWLCPGQCASNTVSGAPARDTEEVDAVLSSLIRMFDAADTAVSAVLEELVQHGFAAPSEQHALPYVTEYAETMTSPPPILLLMAALSFKRVSFLGREESHLVGDIADDQVRPLFSSKMNGADLKQVVSENTESFGAWGYKDSGFVVEFRNDASKAVVMKGDRYNISGVALPKLIPFLETESHLRVNTRHTALPTFIGEPQVAKTALGDDQLSKLRCVVANDQRRVSVQSIDRARHGTGHTQEDMFLIRSGLLESIRLPDAVLWVETEQEVEALISLASELRLCLIPFGGGTNVSHATRCPSNVQEPRPIISVDMRRMKNILSVDEENGLANIQAGVTGADLVREMKALGYTIGHEPDSIEFSTLGGWIATKASGMKRNKYGNIEDIVQSVRVVGPNGVMSQNQSRNTTAFGRVSTGADLSSLVLGSEGNCGIITSAVIRIWPLPPCVEFDGIVFASFEDGLGFVRLVAKLSSFKPASVRLLDNEQFRLGQALKQQARGLAFVKEHLYKTLSSMTGTFSPGQAVCATITYEGSPEEVKYQKKRISRIAADFGGVSAGASVGRAGYDLTFAIAYLRDFAMTYHFLAESFETFVPWSRVEELISRTKERIRREHSSRYLPGKPIVSSRVTQLYDDGACVYFYFCMNYENVPNPSQVYGEIEAAARQEILHCGGSLSHHHGIGKLRAGFMDEVNSVGFKRSLMNMKESMDPDNIFGVRNGAFADMNTSVGDRVPTSSSRV